MVFFRLFIRIVLVDLIVITMTISCHYKRYYSTQSFYWRWFESISIKNSSTTTYFTHIFRSSSNKIRCYLTLSLVLDITTSYPLCINSLDISYCLWEVQIISFLCHSCFKSLFFPVFILVFTKTKNSFRVKPHVKPKRLHSFFCSFFYFYEPFDFTYFLQTLFLVKITMMN